MIKNKLSSAKTYVKEHKTQIGAATIFVGIAGLACKYPDAFTYEAPKQIPTMKIIHVHVNQ